jgi:hypothetical protein
VKGSQLSPSIFFLAISCLMFSSAFSMFRFLFLSLMSAMLLIFSLRALSRCSARSSSSARRVVSRSASSFGKKRKDSELFFH